MADGMSKLGVVQNQSDVMGDVYVELDRQLEKWGPQDHTPLYWLGILMEECGEAAKAAIEAELPDRHNEGDEAHGYYHEMIQVAAVAIAAAENYLRNGGTK